MTESIERELRFIVPAKLVETSQSVKAIAITEIHFLTGGIGIRIRESIRDNKKRYELTFKFRRSDHSLEHTIPISEDQGQSFFTSSREFGLPEVNKTRYVFGTARPFWEVDIYQDKLDYLAIAEMEYDGSQSPSLVARKPDWYLGENWNVKEMDVTADWKFLEKILSTDETEFGDFNQEMHSRIRKIR
jgi:CYTH domain-containing protein